MSLSLLPVIAGAALSSAESSDFNVAGLAIVAICNVMFAFRGIITKRIKASHRVDNFNLFFQVCYLGMIIQAVLLLAASPFFGISGLDAIKFSDSKYMTMLAVNGVTFYAYLQLSWLVLSRVAAVTHSVCNSLRRPVMCLFGWLQFGGISLLAMSCRADPSFRQRHLSSQRRWDRHGFIGYFDLLTGNGD